MTENFREALAFVLEQEKGFSQSKADRGGATNHGISLRFLQGIDPAATVDTIKNLTRDEAAELYWEHFWKACKCSTLPVQLGVAVFDCAVNQGPGTARRLLQRTLKVKDDGYLGPVTLTAALRCKLMPTLVDFLARRAKRYALDDDEQIKTHGRGWFTRLFELQLKVM